MSTSEQAVARPLHLDLLAVARDARRLVDHGGARAGEAVHQGGLAGVRRADDGDDGECIHPDSLANASPKDPATTKRPPQAAASSSSRDVVERAAEVGRQPHARRQEPLALGERVAAQRVQHLGAAEQPGDGDVRAEDGVLHGERTHREARAAAPGSSRPARAPAARACRTADARR